MSMSKSSYNHNLLLRACSCPRATEEQIRKLSYAAGMWATGDRKITKAEIKLAHELLDDGKPSFWWKPADAVAVQFEVCDTVPAHTLEERADDIRATITDGPHAGRMFSIRKNNDGTYTRGQMTAATPAECLKNLPVRA